MRIFIKRLVSRKRWRVEYRLNGKRLRPSFKTKELAEAEAERIEKQVSDSGSAWVSLPTGERTEIMTIVREIVNAGLSLRKVWEDYKRGNHGAILKPQTLGPAYDKFIAEKESQKLSDSAIAAYRSNVGRFIQGREKVSASAVTRDEVMKWLSQYTDSTFNSYLTSLNTFFLWCVHLEYISKSPTEKIKKIDKRRMEKFDKPPHILHYDDCVKLFKSTLENDPGLIRFTSTCLQAGLRPEREAPSLKPGDIGEKIHVRGKTAKDRQARYIEIEPALKEWLALPLGKQPDDKDGPLPPLQGPSIGDWPIKNLRKRFEAVRQKAGLIQIEIKTRPKEKGEGVVKVGQKITETGWGQDCMRHTFASAYYAVHGAEKTIEALGHGDYDMLFGHYRKLMTREEGLKILSITPAICLGQDKPQAPKTRTGTSGATPVKAHAPAAEIVQAATV